LPFGLVFSSIAAASKSGRTSQPPESAVTQTGIPMLTIFAAFRRLHRLRLFGLGLIYMVGLALSLWFAYELRFDFTLPPGFSFTRDLLVVFLWFIPVNLVALHAHGQFDNLLSYFSTPDLKRIVKALAIGSVIAVVIRIFAGVAYAPPRS